MAKKVLTVIKINLPAGEATPAQPLGPALGQHGVAIMEFVKAYNDRTKDAKGQIVPAVITIYEDRSFDFVLKKPPVSEFIKKELKIESGSKTPGRETIATLTQAQLTRIAEAKMEDLNANGNIEAAKKIIAGTARSMGIKTE